MNAAHIHLALTHFPIIGTAIGIGILIYGQFSNNSTVKKVALVLFVLMAISTIPVFLTGEEAEESVEHLSGISESLIEEHEELAEKAIWLMAVLGISSLISLGALMTDLPFAKTSSTVVLLISIATFGLFAAVGNTGGQIRHSEIRAANGNSQSENGNADTGHYEDDDD